METVVIVSLEQWNDSSKEEEFKQGQIRAHHWLLEVPSLSLTVLKPYIEPQA